MRLFSKNVSAYKIAIETCIYISQSNFKWKSNKNLTKQPKIKIM